MNNSGFGKTMVNVPKHSEIKLVTKDKRRHYLISKLNNHLLDFSAIEIRKTKVTVKMPVQLCFAIVELSKIVY